MRDKRVALDQGCRSAAATRNGGDYFPRQDVEKSTVFDLVYKYLREIANRDGKWKQRNSACDRFHRLHARRKGIRERIRTDVGEEIGERSRSRVRKSAATRVETFGTPRSSSQECIADYTKAVRDGRRRAMFYVRDALLYGLQSGLLARRANVLRVSQELRNCFPLRESALDEED